MPPVLPAKRSAGTPLAPSVEKAYYRKCIQLKRRLNEVETANEEARVRRLRLDRAIMKMRLERAFLLEQLSKRVEPNVEGSEASGEEGVGTPPADRPHRDKRRRDDVAGPSMQPPPSLPAGRSSSGGHHQQHIAPRGAAPSYETTVDDQNPEDAYYGHNTRRSSAPRTVRPSSSRDPYASGLPYLSAAHSHGSRASHDGADDQNEDSKAPISRHNGVTGERLSAGSTNKE